GHLLFCRGPGVLGRCAADLRVWALGFGTLEMASRWYVIHVYSGFEKKVAASIREQAEQKGLADEFDEILVPTEEVVEVKRGAKVRKASSGRSLRSPSKSASRSVSATARSPPSTVSSRTSTRKRRGSRSRCRSSDAPPRWSWSTHRSRRYRAAR